MTAKAMFPICAALAMIAWPSSVSAQAAAETAVILSGTGQATGSAARSMGSAVSGSINSAAAQINAARNARAVPGPGAPGAPPAAHVIPGNVDMLEGTDAPTYQVGSGASIRVSGTLVQGTTPACSENCPKDTRRRRTGP